MAKTINALKILEALTEKVDGLPEREQPSTGSGFSDRPLYSSIDENPHIDMKKLRECRSLGFADVSLPVNDFRDNTARANNPY
jgi:hypothetical protein